MVDDFEFYPHSCIIFRGVDEDPVTGLETPKEIYRGKCYLQQGTTSMRGDWLQGQDTVMMDDMSIVIKSGDNIEVTMENGSIYKAIIKQAYPVKDSDFGGQNLLLYQRDGADINNAAE